LVYDSAIGHNGNDQAWQGGNRPQALLHFAWLFTQAFVLISWPAHLSLVIIGLVTIGAAVLPYAMLPFRKREWSTSPGWEQ